MTDIQLMNTLDVDGDISASGNIGDGAGNILANKLDKLTTKPTAGTYRQVTINAEGQVTGGANPTTLAGYGITDAVTLNTAQTIAEVKTFTHANGAIILKRNSAYSSGQAYSPYLELKTDMGDVAVGRMFARRDASDVGNVVVDIRDPNSGNWKGSVKFACDSSNVWATAPTRTYNSANVDDIVTIGSLASNPNVVHTTGDETKVGNFEIIGQFTVNGTSIGMVPANLRTRADSGTPYIVARLQSASDVHKIHGRLITSNGAYDFGIYGTVNTQDDTISEITKLYSVPQGTTATITMGIALEPDTDYIYLYIKTTTNRVYLSCMIEGYSVGNNAPRVLFTPDITQFSGNVVTSEVVL